MVAMAPLRRALAGADPAVRRRHIAVAVGLFAVAGGYTLLSEYSSLPTERVLYLFVLLGCALAALSAYRNGGLVVSILLVSGPVAGALGAYTWIMRREGASPVAMVGSFDGQGAAVFWAPVVLFLGALAFGLGVTVRWGVASIRGR